MTSLVVLALAGLGGGIVGIGTYWVVLEETARRDIVCPTCFGRTDDLGLGIKRENIRDDEGER